MEIDAGGDEVAVAVDVVVNGNHPLILLEEWSRGVKILTSKQLYSSFCLFERGEQWTEIQDRMLYKGVVGERRG